MSADVIDLLAALREGTRRGAGREVDLYHPAPSTRGIGESSDSGGQTQILSPGQQVVAEAATRKRLADGTHTSRDVEWARDRCRVTNLLTAGPACDGCTLTGPVTYLGVEIATSRCELDGVCWRREREAEQAQRVPLPLWRLRKRNGRPNYRHAAEQERFLRDAGWLAWSAGAKKGPEAGVPTSRGLRTRKLEWPMPWEVWVEAQADPARIPPEDADVNLLADWQKEHLGHEKTPIEKLAEATLDDDEAGPSRWRQWEGDNVEPCQVCGDTGGYSIAGHRYCRRHARSAEVAARKGKPLPGVQDENDDIDIEMEVAA